MSEFLLTASRSERSSPDRSGSSTVRLSGDSWELSADLSERDGALYREPRAVCLCFGWAYETQTGQAVSSHELRELLGDFRRGDLSGAKRFSGNHAFVAVDCELAKAWVVSDRWTVLGFYYCIGDGNVAVSSSAAAIAHWVKAPLDGVSLLAHLRSTALPCGRTLFSGVCRSEPAKSAIVIDLLTAQAAVTSLWPLFEGPAAWGFRESVERLVDALVRSVGAAARLGPIIDLTGGNDSRLTAAVFRSGRLGALDPPPRFVVLADDGHPDGVIARQIAQQARWELAVEPRHMHFDSSLTGYTEAALAADGASAVGLEDLRGWQRIRARHRVVRHHLSSVGGELARGFFWRHELLNVGRKRVDFARLLRQRLYVRGDVDLAVVDHGMTLQEHDEAILAPFRAIDRELSDLANPYKLDVMYLARVAQKMAAMTWGYSGFRNSLAV